jgi:hypothetical protein
MYQTDQELRAGFEEATRERMRAIFGGRVCVGCGAPAERLSADRFYCGFHFPERRKMEASSPRVYHCTAVSA